MAEQFAHVVDLSGHQGALLARIPAFLACQKPGRPVASICKATEAQGFVDKSFAPFVELLGAEGVETAGYHFTWGNRSGKAQAKHFHATAAHLVRTKPALDLEGVWSEKTKSFTDLDEVGPVKLVETYWELGQETEHLWGREAIVYTGPGWVARLIGEAKQLGVDLRDHPAARWLGERLLWLAHYTEGEPTVPVWWVDQGRSWWMHQKSGSHPCDLVPGLLLDWNRCRDVTALDPLRDTIPPPTEPAPLPYDHEVISVDQVLDLVARPGGQTLEEIVEEAFSGLATGFRGILTTKE